MMSIMNMSTQRSRHASEDSDSFYLSKNKCTKWAKEPPRTSVRVRRHNIMRETPGPRRTKRWPMVIFYHLLNVAGINAYVMYKNKIDHGISRREFSKHLAVDLVKARQQTRATIPQLPRAIQKRLKRNAPVQDPSPTSRGGPSTTCKRCHISPRSKNKKIRFMCAKCHQQVCHDHSTMICDKCIE